MLLVAATACGDDSPSKTPDAPTPTPDMAVDMPGATCDAAIAGTIAVPGMYAGTVLGGGADHTVGDGVCATQTEDLYFEPKGEDVVVKLTGLTAGSSYVVTLETGADDVSFYVVDACPPMMGAITTGCSNFTDQFVSDPENGVFVAAAAEQYIVVDNPEDNPLTTGAFTLSVAAAQCTPETEDTACSGGTPRCVDFTCVQCASDFDCTGATPVCNFTTNACEAGPNTCTGDDTRDTTGNGDDGPSVATVIATPTAAAATVINNGAICSAPDAELDWFKFTVTTPFPAGVQLTFPPGTGNVNNLNVFLLDSTGTTIESGTAAAGINEAFVTDSALVAGDYYIVVFQTAPTGSMTALSPYVLTLSVAECTDNFGCIGDAGGPICSGAGVCGPSTVACTTDDTRDTAGAGDDGPGGANTIAAGAGTNGEICSAAGERDFFRIAVTNSQGLDVTVTWADTAVDLDPTVYDATGAILATDFWRRPANVKATHLAAGTYYIEIRKFGAASGTTTPYTITGSVPTAAQACTVAGDGSSAACATDFSTQIYRSVCTPATGVCSFKPAGAGAQGAICDSGDDCTSGVCSNITFESDANKSICTINCAAESDCAVVAGTHCTTGFTDNFCVPSCATNLECGAADLGSMTLDVGTPWDYMTCTVATGACSVP